MKVYKIGNHIDSSWKLIEVLISQSIPLQEAAASEEAALTLTSCRRMCTPLLCISALAHKWTHMSQEVHTYKCYVRGQWHTSVAGGEGSRRLCGGPLQSLASNVGCWNSLCKCVYVWVWRGQINSCSLPQINQISTPFHQVQLCTV